MSLDHSALLLLLSAKDKDIVEDIITTTFRFRYEGGVPNRVRIFVSLTALLLPAACLRRTYLRIRTHFG